MWPANRFFFYFGPRAQTVAHYWCRQTYVATHQKQLQIRDYRLPFFGPCAWFIWECSSFCSTSVIFFPRTCLFRVPSLPLISANIAKTLTVFEVTWSELKWSEVKWCDDLGWNVCIIIDLYLCSCMQVLCSTFCRYYLILFVILWSVDLFWCVYRTSNTVYYRNQKMHYIYIYIVTIFYIS